MSTMPSDEGARFLVDQIQVAGEVEWTERLAALTLEGRLSFRALGRTYMLNKDEAGAFVQVTTVDESGTFASSQYRDVEGQRPLLDDMHSVRFLNGGRLPSATWYTVASHSPLAAASAGTVAAGARSISSLGGGSEWRVGEQ